MFEGQGSQMSQNRTQNSARAIKTWCPKVDFMWLFLVRSLPDLLENYSFYAISCIFGISAVNCPEF